MRRNRKVSDHQWELASDLLWFIDRTQPEGTTALEAARYIGYSPSYVALLVNFARDVGRLNGIVIPRPVAADGFRYHTIRHTVSAVRARWLLLGFEASMQYAQTLLRNLVADLETMLVVFAGDERQQNRTGKFLRLCTVALDCVDDIVSEARAR